MSRAEGVPVRGAWGGAGGTEPGSAPSDIRGRVRAKMAAGPTPWGHVDAPGPTPFLRGGPPKSQPGRVCRRGWGGNARGVSRRRQPLPRALAPSQSVSPHGQESVDSAHPPHPPCRGPAPASPGTSRERGSSLCPTPRRTLKQSPQTWAQKPPSLELQGARDTALLDPILEAEAYVWDAPNLSFPTPDTHICLQS